MQIACYHARMTNIDELTRQLLRDERLAYGIEQMIAHTFRPIRESSGYGFDLGRETRFQMPDSMHLRYQQLVEYLVVEMAKVMIPVLHKDATDEAKHNLIRKLGQVLQ
jgi:hypothetical protein